MGEQQQLTQPVIDVKVNEKATFKAAEQNIETGELMKCVMEGIEGLQKVTKGVSNFQAKEKTTSSIEVEDVGEIGITVEDAEKAVYTYRDSRSESLKIHKHIDYNVFLYLILNVRLKALEVLITCTPNSNDQIT